MNEPVQSTKVLTCTCKKQATVVHSGIGCYNVKEVQDKAGGWKFIFLYDGGGSWLCPECFKKAKELAESLVAVVGNKNFPISNFTKVDH